MFELRRRLIALVAGDHAANRQHTDGVAGVTQTTAAPCAESVWTPSGYVTLATASTGSAVCAKVPRLLGGTGYGSTDSSPPTSGYGIGRIYD